SQGVVDMCEALVDNLQLFVCRKSAVSVVYNKPIQHANGVVGNGICGVQLRVPRVELFRFQELLRIVLAEIEVDARNSSDSGDAVRFTSQDILECLNGHLRVLFIVFASATRNELLRKCCRKINLSRGQTGIQIESLFKILDRSFVVCIPESAYALIHAV